MNFIILVGFSLLIGISMVLDAIILVPEKTNDSSLFRGLEWLMGIFDGILGIVLIIVGAFYIYKDKKK